MRRRVAAHYIWFQGIYKMHYLELDETHCLLTIRPLEEEMANTEFYNGIIIPLPRELDIQEETLIDHWKRFTQEVEPGQPVQLYHLQGLSQTAAELGTNNGGSCPHIQRL
ncbi:hypothetical protein [Parabacteroides sp. PF5-9]|uniref:hypothetical protein n=1 Tax=Parabacteroides sp. PF5-9 TaxID=1742404 RepID=UPI002473AB11|nr:hypothetical protein [Parabacteroides sp. PF5-9]MDH6357649.1 hypothetical protein [Parabacteroides sp. PF5-9]